MTLIRMMHPETGTRTGSFEVGRDAHTGTIFMRIIRGSGEALVLMNDDTADQLAHLILDTIANKPKGKTYAS